MTDSDYVKSTAYRLGAALCGIASADRFKDAPQGFHPRDIYPACNSVIVFATRLPHSLLASATPVPYSHFVGVDRKKNDDIALHLSLHLEDRGVKALPIPSSDPYTDWDSENQRGQAILSLRHAGHLAGLGTIGKNTLLTNKTYGNMIRLGAVLTNIHIDSDPVDDQPACIDDCSLCMDNCPTSALDGTTTNQKQCRSHFQINIADKFTITQCNTCRKICPNHTGTGK